MSLNQDALKVWGLVPHQGWSTYYTLVTFGPNKTLKHFNRHLKAAHKQLANLVPNRLRIWFVSLTFGIADVVIVWQAKDDQSAKEFLKVVLADKGPHSFDATCNTMVALGTNTGGRH
jgi:uncharacterized protein with GYD domain